MRVITEEQVREVLPMAEAIERVEAGFRKLASGAAVNHPRRRVALENKAVLHSMAAGDNGGGLLAAKVYATRPGAGAHFVVLLFSAETTELLAAIEADALGQIRTGAATGLATRRLAREDASRLTLIGSGHQAETQLEAIAAVRTLEQVWVYSRTPERRRSFAARMAQRLGLRVEAVESPEKAVRESDVVVTITTARDPVLRGEWLPAGCHVNAAGSNHTRRREIDAEAVKRASLVAVDSLEQARMECGDLIQAEAEGHFAWSRARELSKIVSGEEPGRQSGDQITLFESQGLAMEDLEAAAFVWRKWSHL